MSTNKKFRVQNGLDVTGEVTVGGVTVINADGTVVSDVSDQLVPLQADVAALETSVENIIGTSPETLDTLQEIVAAYEGADSDLQLLVAQTNQSVQDLENSVGAGAALTVTSQPTTINYEESLGSVFKIFASDNHDQGILYSSNNYNSVTVFNRYNTSNSALQEEGFDKSFVTSDAFFLHHDDRVIEYPLDETAIENDQRAVEYVGWPANEYSRMIYADDDVVALITDDNMSSARFRIWTRGDGSSGTTIAIPTPAQDWNHSWGRTITRAGDYFVIGGSRGGSIHNLDGSFVKYFYASTYFSYTQDVNFGGDNKKSAVASYGSTLVIGCPNAARRSGVASTGAILIFDMNDFNIMPTVVYCPTPDYPNDKFGYSVAVTSDRIYAAAPGINQTNGDHPKGRAFVLELDGTFVQEITDPNPNSIYRNFAYFLGVSGTTLAIGAEGYDNSIGSKGGIYIYDTEDLASGHVEELVYPGTDLDYPKRFFVTTAELLTQSASDVIVPSSGVVPAINYLEDKTNDMQTEINALSGTDTSLTTSVAANAAAITANTAAISAEATARQAAIDAIPAPDLSSYATSASVTAGDLALQDQIDAIVGTSPETLDTLQEIVAAFEDADSDLQTLMTANSSDISTIKSFIGDADPKYFQTTHGLWDPLTAGLNPASNYSSTKIYISATEGSDSVSQNILQMIDNGLTQNVVHKIEFINNGHVITGYNSSNQIKSGLLVSENNITQDSPQFNGAMPAWLLYINTTGTDMINAPPVVDPVLPSFDINPTSATDSNYHSFDTVKMYGSTGALVVTFDFTHTRTSTMFDADGNVISGDFLPLSTESSTVVGAVNELHTELQTLAGLDTSIVADVATNTQAIADEVARATAAEAALAADIAAESSARSAKGNTQDTNIAANATAISNEVTRATAAEQANTDAIVVEAAARAAADSDLSASISAIASGVNTGDLTVTGSATFESGINVGSNGGSIGYDDTSEDIQMMSDVDMSGNLIHNLGAPVAATDAASKSYVDGRISNVIGGSIESLDTIKEVVDAFEGADSDLQSLITANSTSVSANTTAIAAETTRAQGVEASLQSQITAAADTSDLDSDIQANATAIATLDAFVGEGNTEAPNYLPAIASNGSSYLGNVGPSATLTGVGTHGVNIVQSNNSSFSAAGSYTLSGLTAGTQYRFDVDVTAVNAGNGLGADGINLYINGGSSSSVGGPTTLVMLGVSKFGGSEYNYFTPTSDTITLVFYPQNTNCEWTIENMSITIEGDSPVALDTTAQTVAGAVNELAAAVADTSSITAEFQAADSDVTAAFTAADAAITTAFQAADASLQAQIDAGAFDGSAIDQNLVPATTDTYSLGTPDKVWKDLYIGPGSLYLNGTKILEDNSGTITMYADAGQNLSFGATGGGSIDLNAGDESIQIKSDLVLSVGETISTVGGAATRFGGSVNMQTHKIENVGAPTADLDVATKLYVDTLVAAGTVSGDRTFDANVVVEGNLTVSGTTTTVNSETISLADNIIDLNSNLTSGAPTEHAGIRVLRGDESAVQVRWNETSDHWEVYNGSAWTKIALDTDDLAEGSTNLYFTEVRARGCVSADDHSCIDYDETTGKFSLDVAETEAAITPDSAKDADKLDGQHGSYYRINVYDANGALVN